MSKSKTLAPANPEDSATDLAEAPAKETIMTSDAEFAEVFGIKGDAIKERFMYQLALVFPTKGPLKEEGVESMKRVWLASKAILSQIKPQSALEAMLSIQVLALHNMAIECTGRFFAEGQRYDVKQDYLRQVVKLSRTYADLFRVLQASQGQGPSQPKIGTVNVNDNAQAIIGDVEHPNGGGK